MRRCAPNFSLILLVDGADDAIEVASATEDGGFFLHILQRDAGYLDDALEITGKAVGAELVVEITGTRGRVIYTNRTPRYHVSRA